MNDLHVVALQYRLGHRDHVDYSKAKPLNYETVDFDIHIVDGLVRVTMKSHFATLDSAKAVVDQKWPHNFGRCGRWIVCLTARKVERANQE